MLTLRPTRLETSPVHAHLADYEVMEDGHSIGRIMEQREPKPGAVWSWSLTIGDSGMAGIKTSGRGDSLEEVKARFPDGPGSLQGLAWGCPTRPARETLGLGFWRGLTYICD